MSGRGAVAALAGVLVGVALAASFYELYLMRDLRQSAERPEPLSSPTCPPATPAPEKTAAKKTAAKKTAVEKKAETKKPQKAVPRESLEKIFADMGTDKGFQHGYFREYDRILAPYRDASVSFLEIGVEKGRSFKSWERYFTNYKALVGISYGNSQEAPLVTNKEQTQFRYLGSQDDVELLTKICKHRGPFDVVIDDGSHLPLHQLVSFSNLIKCVKPGGLYVIEDIETSYWNRPNAEIYGYQLSNVGYGHNGSAVERFKEVVDVVNRKFMTNYKYTKIPGDDLVSSITFAQNMIYMRRKTEVDDKFFGGPYIHAANVIKQP